MFSGGRRTRRAGKSLPSLAYTTWGGGGESGGTPATRPAGFAAPCPEHRQVAALWQYSRMHCRALHNVCEAQRRQALSLTLSERSGAHQEAPVGGQEPSRGGLRGEGENVCYLAGAGVCVDQGGCLLRGCWCVCGEGKMELEFPWRDVGCRRAHTRHRH